MDEKYIKNDIMRYKNNKTSSLLAILSILLNVFYFVSIYKTNAQDYYYNMKIGFSIIYNLLFLLIAFLSSEGVKNYKVSFAIILIVIGAMQFVRIAGIPVDAHFRAMVTIDGVAVHAMSTAQFVKSIIYICGSGAFAIASGVTCILKSMALNKHIASLDEAVS